MSVCLSVCLRPYPSTWSGCTFVCLSPLCLPVCLSLCLFVRPSLSLSPLYALSTCSKAKNKSLAGNKRPPFAPHSPRSHPNPRRVWSWLPHLILHWFLLPLRWSRVSAFRPRRTTHGDGNSGSDCSVKRAPSFSFRFNYGSRRSRRLTNSPRYDSRLFRASRFRRVSVPEGSGWMNEWAMELMDKLMGYRKRKNEVNHWMNRSNLFSSFSHQPTTFHVFLSICMPLCLWLYLFISLYPSVRPSACPSGIHCHTCLHFSRNSQKSFL